MTKKEFTKENLIEFELEYFRVNSKYNGLRYGQVIFNLFGVFEDLFYDANTSYCRDMVWNYFGDLS